VLLPEGHTDTEVPTVRLVRVEEGC